MGLSVGLERNEATQNGTAAARYASAPASRGNRRVKTINVSLTLITTV